MLLYLVLTFRTWGRLCKKQTRPLLVTPLQVGVRLLTYCIIYFSHVDIYLFWICLCRWGSADTVSWSEPGNWHKLLWEPEAARGVNVQFSTRLKHTIQTFAAFIFLFNFFWVIVQLVHFVLILCSPLDLIKELIVSETSHAKSSVWWCLVVSIFRLGWKSCCLKRSCVLIICFIQMSNDVVGRPKKKKSKRFFLPFFSFKHIAVVWLHAYAVDFCYVGTINITVL